MLIAINGFAVGINYYIRVLKDNMDSFRAIAATYRFFSLKKKETSYKPKYMSLESKACH